MTTVKRDIIYYPWLVVILLGCVACGQFGTTIRVKPLASEHFPPKPPTALLDELASEPDRPFKKIAKLIATTHTDDEETVREKMMEKARSLGADAMYITKVDVLRHMGHPRYQSTLDPSVNYSIFSGGPGSGMPMFFDPWTYQQTQQDGTTWTLFLSGVAIRYADSEVQETRHLKNGPHEGRKWVQVLSLKDESEHHF